LCPQEGPGDPIACGKETAMSDRPTPGFSLSALFGQAQLIYRLLHDDRVPTLLKVAIPLGVALYFVMPLDVIPDFLPGIGQLDDIAVLFLAMNLFVKLAPQVVVSEHRQALGLADSPAEGDATTRLHPTDAPRQRQADVVDAPYKVVETREEN
jgi:uncharacterized membrane protein YkvA (DUF1232 family)